MEGFRFDSNSIERKQYVNAELRIDGTGPYWILSKDTVNERRESVKIHEGYTISVAINRPPTTHKGKILSQNDPLSICLIARQYYAEFLFEALTMFGG